MATKKKTSTQKADINIRAAMASGKSSAEKAVAVRQKQQRKRAAAESKIPARRRAPGPPRRLPAITRAFFGTRKSVGVLLAEGDSWFDYPGKDILAQLEDEHLYDVKSVAHMGDCVEDMAHSGGQLIGVYASPGKATRRRRGPACDPAFRRRKRHRGRRVRDTSQPRGVKLAAAEREHRQRCRRHSSQGSVCDNSQRSHRSLEKVSWQAAADRDSRI